MAEKMNNKITPSVMALAYLGDAQHALLVRRMLVDRGISKSADLNREALRFVTAEAQAAAFEKISDLLTEEEAAIFKRAHNSSHLNRPKHASGKDYRVATGFEAVLGLLSYMGDSERLDYLFELSHSEDTDDDKEN